MKNILGFCRRAGAIVVPLLLLAACAGEQTSKATVADVVGDWRASDGEQISLTGDHRFTSRNLGEKSAECPSGENSGTWGFYVEDGKSDAVVSQKATSGDWIGLSFKSDDRQEFSCFVDLVVVDGGKTLCETEDPDSLCGLGVRLTRKE